MMAFEIMRSLPDSSVDAVVCDPPYGNGLHLKIGRGNRLTR